MCMLETCLLRKDIKCYYKKKILSQLVPLKVISIVQANGKFSQETNHKLGYLTQYNLQLMISCRGYDVGCCEDGVSHSQFSVSPQPFQHIYTIRKNNGLPKQTQLEGKFTNKISGPKALLNETSSTTVYLLQAFHICFIFV